MHQIIALQSSTEDVQFQPIFSYALQHLTIHHWEDNEDSEKKSNIQLSFLLLTLLDSNHLPLLMIPIYWPFEFHFVRDQNSATLLCYRYKAQSIELNNHVDNL